MKNKILNKLIFILIVAICIFSLIMPTTVKATGIKDALQAGAQAATNAAQQAKQEAAKSTGVGGIFTQADDFLEVSDNSVTKLDGNLKPMSDMIYNVLLVIGIIIAVGVGLVIAIQFITGSVSQRAKIKETLIPYVCGCVVVFGAFGIWKLVVTILQGMPSA